MLSSLWIAVIATSAVARLGIVDVEMTDGVLTEGEETLHEMLSDLLRYDHGG